MKSCHPLLTVGAISNPRLQLVTNATHFAWIGLLVEQVLTEMFINDKSNTLTSAGHKRWKAALPKWHKLRFYVTHVYKLWYGGLIRNRYCYRHVQTDHMWIICGTNLMSLQLCFTAIKPMALCQVGLQLPQLTLIHNNS